jgi:tRNA uridine 5-carboxymethylaminomethyl modification enzyme
VDEPYRLFTSRSEFRLTVRQDNALQRLAPLAIRLGLYTSAERDKAERRLSDVAHALDLAARTSIQPSEAEPILRGADSMPLAHAMRIADVAKRSGVTLSELLRATGSDVAISHDALVTAELELKYAGYFARERAEADRLRQLADLELDSDLPYERMLTMSSEARQKLAAIKPATLAQAARIPGVSPSDLQNLAIEVQRLRRTAGALG